MECTQNTLYESNLLAMGQLNKGTIRCSLDNPIQMSLYETPLIGPPRCDRCGTLMDHVMTVF
jgi:hypothetical protein